ncbi:hypothetical protein V2J09_013507, partial [Rumex salicifolius]
KKKKINTSFFVISSEIVYAGGLRSPPPRFRIRDTDATIVVDITKMDGLQLSAEARALLFQQGISMVLSRWSSLQLAIENEWGGRNSREKALKLASDIFIWFNQTKGELYIDDFHAISNTEVADGSIEEVSYELMSMHEECLGGNYDNIQRLRASTSQARPVQHVKQMESNDEEDDDDDNDGDMMVDVPETKTNQIPMEAAINQSNPSNAAPAACHITSVCMRILLWEHCEATKSNNLFNGWTGNCKQSSCYNCFPRPKTLTTLHLQNLGCLKTWAAS